MILRGSACEDKTRLNGFLVVNFQLFLYHFRRNGQRASRKNFWTPGGLTLVLISVQDGLLTDLVCHCHLLQADRSFMKYICWLWFDIWVNLDLYCLIGPILRYGWWRMFRRLVERKWGWRYCGIRNFIVWLMASEFLVVSICGVIMLLNLLGGFECGWVAIRFGKSAVLKKKEGFYMAHDQLLLFRSCGSSDMFHHIVFIIRAVERWYLDGACCQRNDLHDANFDMV